MGRKNLFCWLLLIACAVAFHHRVVFGRGYSVPWDARSFHLPLATAVADAWAERAAPWWEPYAYCGRPLFANPQAMAGYPPVVAAAAWGREGMLRRLNLLAVGHIALAGCLAFLLTRRLGMGAAPALVAGLTFELGGLPASQAQHLGIIYAMPWLVLAWIAATVVSAERRIGVAATAFALGYLAGFPAFALTIAVSALLFALTRGIKPALHVAVGGLLALGLVAFQLTSALQLAGLSVAQYRWEWVKGGGGIPAPALVSLLVPNFHGVFDPSSFAAPYELTHLYLFSSVTACLLALYALRRSPALAAVTLVFCLLMLGEHFPPVRMLHGALPVAARNTIYWYPFLGAFLLGLSLLAAHGASKLPRLAAIAAVILIPIETIAISANRPMNSQWIAGEPLPQPPAVADGRRFDTVGQSPYLTMASPLARVRTAGGYDPMALERVIQVRLLSARGHRWGAYYQADQLTPAAARIMGIQSLVTPNEVQRVPGEQPRYWVVHRTRRSDSLAQSIGILREGSFDARREAVVEDFGNTKCADSNADTIHILYEHANEVALEVDAKACGFLVAAEAYFPGWKAEVNDRPSNIFITNAAFRGIPLTMGMNKVIFRYTPEPIYSGVAFSLFALGVTIYSLGRGGTAGFHGSTP